jgi:hypothetical protein
MSSANERPGFAARGAVDGPKQPCESNTVVAEAANLEPLLTREDLATFLKIDLRTLDRMRAGGRLPKPDLVLGARGRGCIARWKPASIRAWLDRGGK